MKHNKKFLMIATTAMFSVGCFGLMGAMKYQNVKTEASDIKDGDVAKAGIDVSSASLEGETPIEKKMDKEIVEKYSYKGYEISFIRYKDIKTGEYLSDEEQAGDYGYKRTFRDIIDSSENSGWNYMLEELKGKKDKITAEIDWKRDENKIVNGKFYGNLIRQCNIFFKIPNIIDDDTLIQIETMAWFSTLAENGKYMSASKSISQDLVEYPGQWLLASKAKMKKVQEKLDKFESISKNKKEVYKYINEAKDRIKQELKDVYGINIVKEIKNDTYEKYNLWGQDILSGSVTIFGEMDDGQKVEATYDLLGNYISSLQYDY
ncbi:hypothetical protein KQI69_04930 [Eubacterium sp. MSJ-13]|uniref:hypothetical protein n=1 Tax=Eubacterium sp. MSJ-13 TaxID=2841513 RepID=UPI001C1250AB|nr:hypothetical protein [Eubacterium sp. MSJ-13]MBU5478545.1 hypothetical protein [Eubacterium sp. MSJ-13]